MSADGQTGMPDSRLGGFLVLGAHDDLHDRYSTVSVFDDAKNGQADLYFCSTDCLRSFFGAIVGDLEAQTQKRMQSARKRPTGATSVSKTRERRTTRA